MGKGKHSESEESARAVRLSSLFARARTCTKFHAKSTKHIGSGNEMDRKMSVAKQSNVNCVGKQYASAMPALLATSAQRLMNWRERRETCPRRSARSREA